jgi:hypothetical protein
VAILLILLALAHAAAPSPQTAASPQATTGIFGRVVNVGTHEPIRRVAIKVYTSKDQWDDLTDGEGRFRFPKLARGEYRLIAHRDGYTDRAYKVERSDFDEQKELPIELYPQGVIAGKVMDGLGQPLQSAQIQALAPDTRAGKVDVSSSAETNDLGEYRLSGLDPGTYRLRAVYREGRNSELDPTPLTMASSYYGGPDKPTAIAVKAGSSVTGIDFTLNPAQPLTVRGTLHTETGVLSEPASLWIMGQNGEGGHNGNGKDGEFEIGDLSPGTYTISAETLNETAPLFGLATVAIRGEDVGSVDLVLHAIPKIEAEIRMEGGAPAGVKLGSIYFIRTDAVTAMNMQIGHPDKDQKFTIALIPGEYSLSFDESINTIGVQRVTLDDKLITDWKLQVDGSPQTKKLVIVLGPKPQL